MEWREPPACGGVPMRRRAGRRRISGGLPHLRRDGTCSSAIRTTVSSSRKTSAKPHCRRRGSRSQREPARSNRERRDEMETWGERSDQHSQRTRSGKPAERGNVLGICFTGHGASIALISPEHGIRALLLERFTGQKDALLFGRQELEGILRKKSPIEASIHWLLVAAFRKFPPSFVFEETFHPFLEALLAGLPIGPEDIDLVVT